MELCGNSGSGRISHFLPGGRIGLEGEDGCILSRKKSDGKAGEKVAPGTIIKG